MLKNYLFKPLMTVGLALLLSTLSIPIMAGEQFQVPDEDPWAPVYARFLYPDDSPEWVVLYLYRERQCLPDDFNLLQFFDFTLDAWNCPMLMRGTVVYENANGLANGEAPRQASLRNIHGVSIPTVFVPIADWMNATADNVLTMPEVEALPNALQGWATFHQDVLHPSAGPGGGGAEVGKWNYRGIGTLMDGRSFRWHASGQFRYGIEHMGTFSVTIR